MSLSISEEIKETFHLAALSKQADVLLTGRQWEQRDNLVQRCEKARQTERALLKERYDTRIIQEQKWLTDKAGSKTNEFKPPWAQDDVFDKTASLAQADKNVRANHENRITRIDQIEETGLGELMQSARAENKIQSQPKQAFNHKADRRHGERRAGKSYSQTR